MIKSRSSYKNFHKNNYIWYQKIDVHSVTNPLFIWEDEKKLRCRKFFNIYFMKKGWIIRLFRYLPTLFQDSFLFLSFSWFFSHLIFIFP